MEKSLSISVVIVTLNRVESLRDTLLSLVRQERQPDEVIVVDNGSTDNTKSKDERGNQWEIDTFSLISLKFTHSAFDFIFPCLVFI